MCLTPSVVVYLEIPKELSFRSAALWREESAASLLAASRFLTDRAGFGMTRVELLLRKSHDYRIIGNLLFPGFPCTRGYSGQLLVKAAWGREAPREPGKVTLLRRPQARS
jgi:hypothetical protein